MHKHELEEQLEEAKELIDDLLNHIEWLHFEQDIDSDLTINTLEYDSAEKFLNQFVEED